MPKKPQIWDTLKLRDLTDSIPAFSVHVMDEDTNQLGIPSKLEGNLD